MFFSKKKSILGVDIGTSYIKVAQVTYNNTPTIDTYGIVNVGSQIGAQNSETSIRQTATVLRDLMARARVTTKRSVISLPNSAVFTSVIDMPRMSEAELASSMQFEAKKYVPLPFSEVQLTWSVISDTPGTDFIKILLIAVPNHVMQNYKLLFQLAGLELEVVEIEALSLIRSLIIDTDKNSVIIDIGAKTTGLNVIKNGLLQLTRNLNIGGDTITDRIAQTLNITPARAEQFKKQFGVSEESFLPDSIKPVLNTIKGEVKQLLSIYHSHNVTLDSIVMVGGGSQLPGITDYFKDLGIPAVLGDPLRNLSYSPTAEPLLRRFSLQLPIAIGLALNEQK